MVYASTCSLIRRNLWSRLQFIFNQHSLPWSIIGEFNAIIGAHEYSGSSTPARDPMMDFSNWSDSNHLIHIPTSGARFTWSNGRRGASHTQKRCVCHQISCFALVRNRSSHYRFFFIMSARILLRLGLNSDFCNPGLSIRTFIGKW